jgi:hypothetical protein
MHARTPHEYSWPAPSCHSLPPLEAHTAYVLCQLPLHTHSQHCLAGIVHARTAPSMPGQPATSYGHQVRCQFGSLAACGDPNNCGACPWLHSQSPHMPRDTTGRTQAQHHSFRQNGADPLSCRFVPQWAVSITTPCVMQQEWRTPTAGQCDPVITAQHQVDGSQRP